jgi:hypothetical protein
MGMMKRLSLVKSRKKACGAVKVDTVAKEETELGVFYLRNASIIPSDMFPKDIPDKICTTFTCKGKDCNNVDCNFIHPRRPSELKRETIFGNHQSFHQMRYWLVQQVSFHEDAQISDKIKKLLGNTKGPTRKTA